MPPEPPPAADLTRPTGRHAATIDGRPSLPQHPADPYAAYLPYEPYEPYEKPAERPGHPADDLGAAPFPAQPLRRRRRHTTGVVDGRPEEPSTALLTRTPHAAHATPAAPVLPVLPVLPVPAPSPVPPVSGPMEFLTDVPCPAPEVEPGTAPAAPPRRRDGDGDGDGAARRRDLRLISKATEIVKRDKRRRWIAAGTLVTVIGTISVPSIVMNIANADGVSSGTMALKPGGSGWADSKTVLADGTATSTFALPARPAGGSLYLAVEMRGTTKGAYRAKVRVYPDGQMTVGLSKVVGGAESSLGGRLLGARVATAGSTLHLQGSVARTDPTTLRVRAWLDGTKQPEFQFTTKDTTPALVNGSVRAWSYLSGAATAPMTLTFRNLAGEKTGGPSPVTPPTVAPEPPLVTPTYTPSATKTTVKPSITAPSKPLPTSPGGGSSGGSTGPGNTGVPGGTDLKVHSGDLVVTKDGATFDGLDIRGFVDIRAADVTIRNSLIRGGVAGGGTRGIVNVTNTAARRFVLEDSEIRPANPSVKLDGVNGANFTLRRVEVDGGVDAVKVFGDNVRIESSWLHGTQSFASDPNQGGGATHNDAIQMQGGENVTVKNNRIEGGSNAAIMVTQDFAATKNLTISGNRLNGGACTVNIAPTDLPTIGPISLTNNVFVKDSRVANCSVARTASTQMTASGNTFTDGSAAKINVWN